MQALLFFNISILGNDFVFSESLKGLENSMHWIILLFATNTLLFQLILNKVIFISQLFIQKIIVVIEQFDTKVLTFVQHDRLQRFSGKKS